jgi:hypothetical protein
LVGVSRQVDWLCKKRKREDADSGADQAADYEEMPLRKPGRTTQAWYKTTAGEAHQAARESGENAATPEANPEDATT